MTTPSEVQPAAAGADLLSRLAAVTAGSTLEALLAQRPEIVRYAEGSYRSLLEPDEPGGLSRAERELVALRVAALTGGAALAIWHRDRLAALGADEATLAAAEGDLAGAAFSERELTILRHVDLVSRAPAAATATQLAELAAVGLRPRDIVVLGQLTGFLAFYTRALRGLHLLAEGR